MLILGDHNAGIEEQHMKSSTLKRMKILQITHGNF